MRSIRHWTPRYAFNRVQGEIWEHRNQDVPWLNRQANQVLDDLLLPTDVGLEWGSGRSTAWFAARLQHLTSIEDQEDWFRKVTEDLQGLTNTRFELLPTPPRGPEARESPYVAVVEEFADDSLNFALVDGLARDHCALAVLPKIARGGVLVIDDTHNKFDRGSPENRSVAPASRWGKGHETEVWATVWDTVSTWRAVWTSNGLKDTAIFIRP